MSIQLRDLVHYVIDGVHEDFHQLVTRTLRTLPFEQRRTALSAYIHKARRQLCQLLAIIDWSQRHRHAYAAIQDTASFLNHQHKETTLVTDKFFWLHDDLFRKRVASAVYDVPTAIDVLGYGTFPRFPREIELGRKSTGGDFTLKEMEHAIRSRMVIQDPLPSAYSVVEISAGIVRLTEPHHFSLSLTLNNTEPVSAKWHMLHLHLLLDDSIPEQAPRLPPLDNRHQRQLHRLLAQLLEESPQPLLATFKVCHSLSVELQLVILSLQADILAMGDWGTQLTVKSYLDKNVVDLGFWPYEANSRIGTLWRDFLTTIKEKGGGGQGDDDDDAVAGGDANDLEVLSVVNDPPLPSRCCYLRLRVSRNDGLATLLASLGVGADGEPDSKIPCLDLAFDPSHLSVQDLLYKATSMLLPWKVDMLCKALRKLAACWGGKDHHHLPAVSITTEHHGIRLALYETRIHVTVNVKTGNYVVTSNMSSAASLLCLEEFQKALNFVDLGEQLLKDAFMEVLRLVIVDQLSRTAMALKLYPNRRWAQLLPILNAQNKEQGQVSTFQLAVQLPSPESSRGEGGDRRRKKRRRSDDWALLGLGVRDDMSVETCLILASGDGMTTLPKLQSQVELKPVAAAFKAQGMGPKSSSHGKGESSSMMPYQKLLSDAAALAIGLIEIERTLIAAKGSALHGLSFPPSSLIDLATGRTVQVPGWSSPPSSSSRPHHHQAWAPSDVMVRCQVSDTHGWLTWEWSFVHPALLEASSSLVPQGQVFIIDEEDPQVDGGGGGGSPGCHYRYEGAGQVVMTFQAGWHADAIFRALANAVEAIGELAKFRGELTQQCGALGLTISAPPSFFEVLLTGDALGLGGGGPGSSSSSQAALSIRHVGLLPSEAQHSEAERQQLQPAVAGTLTEGGPFYLILPGELRETCGRGSAWSIIESVYNRTRNLSALVGHVRSMAAPLKAIVRASKQQWGTAPQIVPWSVKVVAIYPPALHQASDGDRKAVVVRLEGPDDDTAVVERVDDKHALKGQRMTKAELTPDLLSREFRDWLVEE